MFQNRADGELIRHNSDLRKMMPFLMQKRNESIVFFEHDIEVDDTQAVIRDLKKTTHPHLTFFHVVMAALNRMMAECPRLNRYIIGHRTYQRQNFIASFAVKPRMVNSAEIKSVKVELKPEMLLSEVVSSIDNAIGDGRSEQATTSEKEMKWLLKLPAPLVRFVVWAQRCLDSFNLLPHSLLRNDPLYATAFVANLGSLGVEAPFHHLYEYGGVSVFLGFGRMKDAVVVDENQQIAVKKIVTFRCSLDERIADGFYAAKGLKLFERLLKDPQLLVNGHDKTISAIDK